MVKSNENGSNPFDAFVAPYVVQGLPDSLSTQSFMPVMPDTNIFHDLSVPCKNNSPYIADLYGAMFAGGNIIVPDIIMDELSRQWPIQNVTDKFLPVFQNLQQHCTVHRVTFEDMEQMLAESNGSSERAFRLAKNIALQLFHPNPSIKAALQNTSSFKEIENVLIMEQDNAGERVILFFAMLFISEHYKVKVYSNEVALYTDRILLAANDSLRSLLVLNSVNKFYERYELLSYDVILFEIMLERILSWGLVQRQHFVVSCRSNKKPCKHRIASASAKYSDTVSCNNNTEFLSNFEKWSKLGITISFG